MLKIIRITTVMVLFFMLIGCSSMQSSADTQKNNKKISTALINTQLGLSYLQHQQVQVAKQKLLLALEQAPNIPETWYSMAYFLEVTGNKEKAQQYYLRSIALAPKKGEVQNNYGTFLCRSGDYKRSIEHFMLAIQDPQYLEISSAYENAGLCALKIPNKTLAMQYFNKAVMEDPNHPTSLIELASLNYQNGNYALAKEQLHQYSMIAPATKQSQILSAELAAKMKG